MAGWSKQITMHFRKSNIVNVFSMPSQAEKLSFNVSSVPYSYSTVSRPSNHQVLVKRWTVNAHYFLYVTFNGAGWPLRISNIPNLELLVISYWSKYEFVKVVPGNILHNGAMSFEVEHCILVKLVLISRTNIPNTYSTIIRAWKQQTFL